MTVKVGDSGHILRFIEFMDVGNTNGWRMDEVMTGAQIIECISAEFPLQPVCARYPREVAARWAFADHGHDLRGLLRAGASDETLRQRMGGIWVQRDDRYSELRGQVHEREHKVEMSYIGG